MLDAGRIDDILFASMHTASVLSRLPLSQTGLMSLVVAVRLMVVVS
jgi:hypothetical protein